MLTEAGIAAMRQAWPIYARGIHDAFARAMTDAEADVMAGALERIVTAARGAAENPPEREERDARTAMEHVAAKGDHRG